MKTIIIDPAESSSALAASCTTALCEEFGVTPTKNGAVSPFSGTNIGFYFDSTSNTQVVLKMINAYGQSQNISTISFSNISPYMLEVYYSLRKTAIAVVFRMLNQIVPPSALIAKNELGGYMGMVVGGAVTFVSEIDSRSKSMSCPLNTMNAPAFSLFRLPDIYDGTMFEEVYSFFSAPSSAALAPGILIHTKEKDFIPIKGTSGNTTLAIPL